MNFNSAEYEWLVIAGNKAQFKGSGMINCLGDCGFLLTAYDSCETVNPYKFRIKIWDKVSDLIIYDNQVGTSDTSDAATTLAGGSIVIQSK